MTEILWINSFKKFEVSEEYPETGIRRTKKPNVAPSKELQ